MRYKRRLNQLTLLRTHHYITFGSISHATIYGYESHGISHNAAVKTLLLTQHFSDFHFICPASQRSVSVDFLPYFIFFVCPQICSIMVQRRTEGTIIGLVFLGRILGTARNRTDRHIPHRAHLLECSRIANQQNGSSPYIDMDIAARSKPTKGYWTYVNWKPWFSLDLRDMFERERGGHQ